MARSPLLDSRQFFNLMRRRNRRTAKSIDARVNSDVQELAVMMSDSSGFSRKTHNYGILQFLAVMTQSYDRLIPILERRRGICLSHNADNILAVFVNPADAVQAGIDMHRWLKRYNRGKSAADRFSICIGIHFGPMVRLKDNVFGATVNVAAKIGEDLAGADEIIVTREVADRIRGKFRAAYARSTELGGKTVELYRVRY